MQKTTKQFIGICSFFILAFVVLTHLFFTTRKANNLFEFLRIQTTNAYGHASLFAKEYYNHPIDVTFYNIQDRKNAFVSVTLENVSPLLCSQILNRVRPFMLDVFLNETPVFFGSDWRCFKKLNHDITFQFEAYNYTTAYKMDEPKACLSLFDCNIKNNEICYKGYCLKREVAQ